MTRRAVASLTAAVALGVAVFFTLYSLVPVTRSDEPGLSSLFVGTMMTFVMGVQVFAPALVRRGSLRLVLAVSLAVLGIGALITGIAQGTALLLLGAVSGGAAFGVLIVAGAQGVALLVPGERLGRALGVYGLVTMAASAIGSPAGVQLALAFSPSVFGVCALVAGLLGAVLSFGIPAGVGRTGAGAADAAVPTARRRGPLAALLGIPWLAVGLLLAAVVLLSHGLTSLPVTAAAQGAALVVFAVQAGNALGRWLGGELEARTSARGAVLAGALLLASGGALGALVPGPASAIVSGVLLGLGVGVVQTVTLHTTMLRMDSGRASVVWNLGVDGGLWIGGILWGLAIASGLVGPGALLCSALILVLGGVLALRLRGAP
ncbi:MFS transporter [Gulosibacter sp. 10]|uniref:MFS transporter n=1 Tax=Gulosibacter sp. 10 TaxID=1255570 RepID=UPI00097F05F1|nr:MFS transporter [Gulosibacter sp. 10]SJM68329.1 putative transport protein [Gulosibacter sp. 10]